MKSSASSKVENVNVGIFIEHLILKSRYLLVPLFLSLLYGIVIITIDFFEVLTGTIQTLALTEHTLQELELLDITMIANLIWLISAGSYYVFVNTSEETGLQRPRCLEHVSTGILKEKMAGSLIGVSSVHLLQVFLHISESHETINVINIGALISIHLMFILGLFIFNYANKAPHHNHNKDISHEAVH